MMRSSRTFGIPRPHRAFQRASLSTESKAALISRYTTFRGWSNSRCISDSNRNATIASIVDGPATNPDCSGRRVMSRRGWMRAKRTCAKKPFPVRTTRWLAYSSCHTLFSVLFHSGSDSQIQITVHSTARSSSLAHIKYFIRQMAKNVISII